MSPCANEGQFVPWAEFPDSSFAATCADAVIKFPALEDTKGCDDYTDVVPGELLSFYEVQSFVAAACCAGEVPVCKPNVLETPCKDPDAFDPYKEFWVTDMPFPFSCSEQVFAPGSNFDQVMDCGDPGFDDVARWFSDGCCEGGYKASVCYGFGAPDYKDTMTDFVGLYKTVIPCKDPFDFDIYKYLDEYTQCGQIVGFLPALTDWEFGLVGAMCCKKPPELCAAGSDFLYDGGDPTWPPGVTCEMVAADLQGIFDPEYAKESDEYAKEVCGMAMDTDGTTYAAWAVGLAYFCCEGRKSHCDEIIPQACSDKDASCPTWRSRRRTACPAASIRHICQPCSATATSRRRAPRWSSAKTGRTGHPGRSRPRAARTGAPSARTSSCQGTRCARPSIPPSAW